MKLFHTENGKEVVYVQMQDIMHMVNETDVLIPATVMTKVFTGVVIVDDSNRFNFVRFDEEHEVNFFREIDFIIDFDKYKELTDEQLEEEAQKLASKSRRIAEKWNSMTEKERKKNISLCEENENIGHMINFLYEIYAVKHGLREMPFPEFVKIPKKTK